MFGGKKKESKVPDVCMVMNEHYSVLGWGVLRINGSKGKKKSEGRKPQTRKKETAPNEVKSSSISLSCLV